MDTLPHRFFRTALQQSDTPAFAEISGNKTHLTTWGQAATEVRKISAALTSLGIQAQDRVAIWADNSSRWVALDIAIMASGAISVPIYASSTILQAEHILRETEAKACFIGPAQADALKTSESAPSACPAFVLLHSEVPPDATRSAGTVSWGSFYSRGMEGSMLDPGAIDIHHFHLASIIYTSGASGRPKGVQLDHRSVTLACDALAKVYSARPGEAMLCYLPLAHAIERLVSVFLPVSIGATVYFAESSEQLRANLRTARPTVFVGVPRVWEKFAEGIRARVAQASVWKKILFAVALRVGKRVTDLQERGQAPSRFLRKLHRATSRLVSAPVRNALGFDRTRLFLSGGAPLSRDVLDFLHGAGIPVLEVYGQTETIVTAVNTLDGFRRGSVGRPVPNVRARIGPEGEIEVFGEHVFRGYWKSPSAASFTDDGWFRTGDIGSIDAAGFLFIRGRKNAILVTSSGKKVPAEPLEAELCAIPGVAQALLIGEGRPFLVAILTPAAENIADAQLPRSIEEGIAAINMKRAPYEQIKRFLLLPRLFTLASEELTPTLKLRRKVIEIRYSSQIEDLYGANKRT
jgi:long-chain acyl-CoA synthetase